MKVSKMAMMLVLIMFISTNSFAGPLDQLLFGAKAKPEYKPLPPATVYTKQEFEALAEGPRLVTLISQYHHRNKTNEDALIEEDRKKAGKAGAEGLYVISSSMDSQEGRILTVIKAESFILQEPTLDKIKFILEKRAERFSNVVNASDIYIKSIMHHIVAQKYTEIGDYILSLIIDSPKYLSNEKIVMLDGYKALLGDNAIEGIKKVSVQRGVEAEVKTHALTLLPGNVFGEKGGTKNSSVNDDGLYKLIVTRNNHETEILIFSYTKNATPAKIDKLRKLMKNHPSEVVRAEAGKALVRLHDTDYVENALQSERSDKVVTDIKKEMML